MTDVIDSDAETPVIITAASTAAVISTPPASEQILSQSNGAAIISTTTPHQFIVSQVGPQGARGEPGTGINTLGGLLVNVTWGSPSAESGNSITVAASITDANEDALATSILDVEVIVTDGATDNEPSSTAVITAADSPVGTVLAGSGTATVVCRSDSGAFAVKVTETLSGFRYLWLRGAGHCRLWPRSTTGVLELNFT